MKEEIQRLVAGISELVRNERFANRFNIDQQLTQILEISDAMKNSRDVLSKELGEVKRSLAGYKDKSRGWMNSVHELTRDKETLSLCVRALARAIEGGDS